MEIDNLTKNILLVDSNNLMSFAFFSKIDPVEYMEDSMDYIVNNFHITKVIFCFDSFTPGNIRFEIYPEYKKCKSRKKPDGYKDELIHLSNLIFKKELFNFDYDCLRVDGFEGDDLISFLRKKAVSRGYKVYILSNDKDFFQIVGPDVHIIRPKGGFNTLEVFKEEDVISHVGLPPSKILDYLVMTGDVVDNIPGIPGIGPKTAVKLLQDYGGLSEIISKYKIIGNKKLSEFIEENDGIEKLKIYYRIMKL